jgi:hypothetical protein
MSVSVTRSAGRFETHLYILGGEQAISSTWSSAALYEAGIHAMYSEPGDKILPAWM